jgi:bifunctional DNA-binding transcriptional regulator/antitoxin component of YhaV-PrlF toxin-antitoxin module
MVTLIAMDRNGTLVMPAEARRALQIEGETRLEADAWRSASRTSL